MRVIAPSRNETFCTYAQVMTAAGRNSTTQAGVSGEDWITKLLLNEQAHKVHVRGEDWRQLDGVTWARRVIEVAVARIDAVVA